MATGTIKTTTGTTATITAGTTGITQFGRVWKDPGTGTVRIYFTARKSTDISINDVLGIVPSGFRPKETAALYGYLYTGSGLCAAYYGSVDTSGNIKQTLGSSIREVFFVSEYSYA